MASISTNKKNGTKRVLFTDEQCKRRTIQLGKVTAKAAESFKLRVEALDASKRMGVPLDGELSVWLRDLSETMHGRLAKVGLVQSRINAAVVTLEMLLKRFEANGIVKASTRRTYQQTLQSLLNHFGGDIAINTLTVANADEWRKAISESSLATATVSKRVRVAKAIFRKAVKWDLLLRNPFEDLRSGSQSNPDRAFYITHEMMRAVLNECPSDQWRCILILCRYAGLRCPSELIGLTWGDVNWERKLLTVRSPKTAGYEGHEVRIVPITQDVMPILETLYYKAETGSIEIIDRQLNTSSNLRTNLKRMILRAGMKPWPRIYQNLRSSRATQWLDEAYPHHVVAAWMGHSEQVLSKHYAQVLDTHLERAINYAKSDALDVQKAAQHPSAPLRTRSHGALNSQCFTDDLRANANECETVQTELMTPRGFEPLFHP